MKRAFLLVGLAFVASTGWAQSDEEAAREAMREALKDPESARFGKFTMVNEWACLGVNAKNSYGGYVGEQQEILIKEEGKWFPVQTVPKKFGHDFCVKVITDSAAKTAGSK